MYIFIRVDCVLFVAHPWSPGGDYVVMLRGWDVLDERWDA